MAAKLMSSSTSMSDFQTSKLSKSGKQKYRSKSASFSYQNSEEIHEKKNIRHRSKSASFSYQNSEEIHEKKNIRPPSAEKMHWPSVMKGSVHQAFLHLKFAKGFGFSEAFGCVTYRWHPSQTRMR